MKWLRKPGCHERWYNPVKLRWKIAAGIVASLVLIIVGAAAWIAFRPPVDGVVVDPGPTGTRVNHDGLLGNYFPARPQEARPGILLLGGSEGGLSRDVSRQAKLLQEAGFHVLHLAYHTAPDKPPTLKRIPLEEFYSGIDWLKEQPAVDGDNIAIVGYSKGAEAALLVATRYPGIKAVVAGMPSSVVWDGLDVESFLIGGISSSWKEAGVQIASLAYGSMGPGDELLPVFVNALKELPRHPETIIPVEQFHGSLMMVCGERDNLWPACQMGDQIVSRARKKGRQPPVLLRYADAGHGVMGAPAPPDDPEIVKFARLGGTAEANARARADSWPKIIRFLKLSFEQQR